MIANPSIITEEIGYQTTGEKSCPLKSSLWACAQSFNTTRKGKAALGSSYYQRIWIFTNDDDPLRYDIAEQSRVIQV